VRPRLRSARSRPGPRARVRSPCSGPSRAGPRTRSAAAAALPARARGAARAARRRADAAVDPAQRGRAAPSWSGVLQARALRLVRRVDHPAERPSARSEAARAVPADSLLLETDSPDQTPSPAGRRATSRPSCPTSRPPSPPPAARARGDRRADHHQRAPRAEVWHEAARRTVRLPLSSRCCWRCGRGRAPVARRRRVARQAVARAAGAAPAPTPAGSRSTPTTSRATSVGVTELDLAFSPTDRLERRAGSTTRAATSTCAPASTSRSSPRARRGSAAAGQRLPDGGPRRPRRLPGPRVARARGPARSTA
jgi:hypothetical protein